MLPDAFENRLEADIHGRLGHLLGFPVTCSIPHDIEELLAARAAKRQTTVDHLVLEALSWYLHVDEETLDELAAWQEVRDEAADLIEDQAP